MNHSDLFVEPQYNGKWGLGFYVTKEIANGVSKFFSLSKSHRKFLYLNLCEMTLQYSDFEMNVGRPKSGNKLKVFNLNVGFYSLLRVLGKLRYISLQRLTISIQKIENTFSVLLNSRNS
jgi:hypothetical protein